MSETIMGTPPRNKRLPTVKIAVNYTCILKIVTKSTQLTLARDNPFPAILKIQHFTFCLSDIVKFRFKLLALKVILESIFFYSFKCFLHQVFKNLFCLQTLSDTFKLKIDIF